MKKFILYALGIIVLILVFQFIFGGGPDKETIRSTDSGEVIGSTEGDNYVWRGIPFAKPPVGDLRWKAPIKPDSWEGTLEALESSEACFQPDGMSMLGQGGGWSGSEDCLYLNVWSPKEANDKKLPVMMWIHGGGNRMGSASGYDPQAMVSKQDVVVVVVQYRMSTLGWFRHPSLRDGTTSAEDDSGNFGTLDTIMALRCLYASPLAQGLFHKAIVQSGIVSTASAVQAESYYPETRISGTVSMSNEELSEYLRNKSPAQILEAEVKAEPRLGGMTRAYNDGHVIRSDGIEAIFSDASATRGPIIFGTNRYETKLFNMWNPSLVRSGEETNGFLPWLTSWVLPALPQEIYRPDYYDAVNQYGSDSWKEKAADTPASQMYASGHMNTYVYRFDWQDLPEFNGVELSRLAGAAHALEIPFVFGSFFDSFMIKTFFDKEALNSAMKLSDHMISYWTQFAYTGDPGMGRDSTSPEWKPWSEEDTYIVLDSDRGQNISMRNNIVSWESLVQDLTLDTRLSNKEKCEILYGGSNEDDGYPWDAFNEFEGGYCLSLDLSYLDRGRRESTEGDNND